MEQTQLGFVHSILSCFGCSSITFISIVCVGLKAFRMDSPDNSLAGKQDSRKNNAGNAEEIRRFPGLPPQTQTSQSPREMSTGDQLQHPADKIENQQSTSFYAIRGKNGFSK